MLTEKQFIELMKTWINLQQKEEKVDECLKTLSPDFGGFHLSEHNSLIGKLLQLSMKDEENDWIGYWMYELDYGKDYKDGSVTIYGKPIPLKTLKDLYRIIVNENKEKKSE